MTINEVKNKLFARLADKEYIRLRHQGLQGHRLEVAADRAERNARATAAHIVGRCLELGMPLEMALK